MTNYQNEKNFMQKLGMANKEDGGPFNNIDLEQEYGANNFRGVTNLMDDLLNTTAQNLNNRQGLNLKASDLRQFVNLAMDTRSLAAMHSLVQSSLNHTNNCVMSSSINYTITKAITEANRTQSQGMEY